MNLVFRSVRKKTTVEDRFASVCERNDYIFLCKEMLTQCYNFSFILYLRVRYRQRQATRQCTSIFYVCCSIIFHRWATGMLWNGAKQRQRIDAPSATRCLALRLLLMPPCESDCTWTSSKFSYSKLHRAGDWAYNVESSRGDYFTTYGIAHNWRNH